MNDVSDIFTYEGMDTIPNYVTRIPDAVSYEMYEWRILQ